MNMNLNVCLFLSWFMIHDHFIFHTSRLQNVICNHFQLKLSFFTLFYIIIIIIIFILFIHESTPRFYSLIPTITQNQPHQDQNNTCFQQTLSKLHTTTFKHHISIKRVITIKLANKQLIISRTSFQVHFIVISFTSLHIIISSRYHLLIHLYFMHIFNHKLIN